MARSTRAGRRLSNDPTWPGFVDVLTTLLLVFVFLLAVFVLAQFFLGQAITGKDKALEELNAELSELADVLSMEVAKNATLSEDLNVLQTSLLDMEKERDTLNQQLLSMTKRAEADEKALAALQAETKDDKAEIQRQILTVAKLQKDIEALEKVRQDLESKVGDLVAQIEMKDRNIGDLRDQNKVLEAKLADESERTLLAQKRADETVALLNAQMAALRKQLSSIQDALNASEKLNDNQKALIAEMGKKLNTALATRVQELARYRSDFFGRLRKVLGNRSDIRIVGDRFVFQSELLFKSGKADLDEGGKAEMKKLADTLQDIAKEIPEDLPWVLRIDGHTDVRPIFNNEFRSNWELSSARAVSVVKYMIQQGVPAQRLAAAGFAEFHPLDDRKDEIAYRRNRRIEFKFTQR